MVWPTLTRLEKTTMTTGTQPYLTSNQAAELIGLSRSWLEKRRVFGDGPPYYKLGNRRVLYRLDELLAWIEQHRSKPMTSGKAWGEVQ